ncbi:tyrosine-protein kinase [soil metagenome]
MNTTLTKTEKRNTSFLEDVTFKYLPYWPLFLLLSVIFLSLGWAYTKYKNPIYEVNASILLNDEKKGADENQVDQSLNLPTPKKIVENELEVLQSRALMDSVVMQLGLYAPMYEKATLKSIPAYSSAPVLVQVRNPEKIAPQVKYPKISFLYNNNGTVTIDNKAYPLNQYVSTAYGEVMFTHNPHVVTPAKHPLYFSLVNVKEITASILDQLDVSAVGKLSSVVKLTLKDENKTRGEDILNSLLNRYNRSSIEYKSALAKNTLAFLDERIASLQNELRSSEKQVQNYKANNRITNLGDEARLYLQDVSENDQKVANLNLQISALDQVENYVTTKGTSAGLVPAAVGNMADPTLSRLIDKLYDAEIQYDRLRLTTAENNPMVRSLANQIETMRPTIMENIRSQKQNLIAGRNTLSRTNGSYNNILQRIPEKEKQLIEVSRDQVSKSNTYAILLQKREQIALSSAGNVPDVKIVDVAQASLLPVGPKKSTAYLIALAAAAAICAAFIAFKELLSSKILFRKDIEKFTDVPVLGEISNFKTKNNLINAHNRVIQEQLRQVQAAAGLYHLDDNTRKILVTSGIAKEGKSVISSNLALNMSQSGKKVVLIDGDMKHPVISETFNLHEQAGLADYLQENCSAAFIVNNTSYENLFVIGAGTSRLNPTELLTNGRLQGLLEYLETEFDYIIIDSSPLNLIADGYIYTEYVDQTFMVIRHGYTSKSFIKNLDYDTKMRSLKNLSIIFNGIKHRGFLKNDFGYGYGYENSAMMKKKLRMA